MAWNQSDTRTNYRQQRHINASDYFAGLSGKVKQIAEEEAERMANTMLHVFHNRLSMGVGNGRFPRHNPNVVNGKGNREGGKSKKMFNTWEKQARPNGEYWVFTNGPDSRAESHNYAQQLVTGKGWPLRMINSAFTGINRDGSKSKLVVANGGLIFSSQMPKGLEPWLISKRNLFEARAKERITQELG